MIDECRTRLISDEIERVDGVRPGSGAPTRKHAKMALNPFRFLRGAAQLYYTDLAQGAVTLPVPFVDTARKTAILGDCHMANFGFVTEKGSGGEHIFFGPDDFDEACIGRAGWDLLRFLTSHFLSRDLALGILDGRYETDEVDDLDDMKAPDEDETMEAAHAFLEAYLKESCAIADEPNLRNRTLSKFGKHHPLHKYLKKARKRAIGGKNFETKSSLGKAVEIKGSGLCFRERDRYRRLDDETRAAVHDAFRPYVDDDVLDIVQRLGQGTGSLNMPRYYLLVGPAGASTSAELPMCQVVEIKQQRPTAAIHAFPDFDPRNVIGPAHLTVNIQRRVQREPDLLLDEAKWNDAHWLVRSRHHARKSADPEEIFLAEDDVDERVTKYVEACGTAVALAHARGDNRSTRFETSIAAAIRQDGEALVESAKVYAQQTIEDWRAYCSLLPETHGDVDREEAA